MACSDSSEGCSRTRTARESGYLPASRSTIPRAFPNWPPQWRSLGVKDAELAIEHQVAGRELRHSSREFAQNQAKRDELGRITVAVAAVAAASPAGRTEMAGR